MGDVASGSGGAAEQNHENESKALDACEPRQVRFKKVSNVYGGDVVVLKSKPNTRGLVFEVAGSYYPSLPDNKVSVLWIDDTYTVESIGSISVVDRMLCLGSYFCSESDRAGQMGFVLGANTVVDLQGADGKIIKGVPGKDLKRVGEFNLGDYVVSGSWVGRVREVTYNVNVLFDDGAICKVAKADRTCLEPSIRPPRRPTSSPFYPGQRVRAVSSDFFKTCRWIDGCWKADRLEGTVVKVETVGAIVHWIASVHSGTNLASAPPAHQNPKDLTLACGSLLPHWMLADRCLPYPYVSQCADEHAEDNGACLERSEVPSNVQTETAIGVQTESVGSNLTEVSNYAASGSNRGKPKSNSTSASSSVPREGAQDTATHQKKLRRKFLLKKDNGRRRIRRKDRSFKSAPVVANTSTKVDVIWQDGTREYGISSTSLTPVDVLHEHDFFPEQCVANKVFDGADDYSTCEKSMGVVRSVDAKDQTVSVSWFKPILHHGEPKEVGHSETVSAYDLLHMDHVFRRLDIVARLPSSVSRPPESTKHDLLLQNEHRQKDFTRTSLSWVGQIVGFRDGEIQVMWFDGFTSTVGPHEICIVGQNYGTLYDLIAVEDASRETSWETDNEDNGVTDCLDDSATAKDDALNPTENSIERENGSVDSHSRDGSERKNVAAADAAECRTIDGDSHCFKQFDVVQSPQDHHYLGSMTEGISGRMWVKKVQQEWGILENNLPDHIYVRAFEDRMDLIRAVIVGASGTPYQDGLFFFDLHLPPEYPQVPPSAYYHSGGLRLNPNLYEHGTVCLSLLNTFGGEGVEQWNPLSSSILQVLVSIQGLVLNERPYFNRAGYEKKVGTARGEKNALPYNESAYLMTLKSMMYHLRRPPMRFERFMKKHFRSRGQYILKACEAYLQRNVMVGTLTDDACTSTTTGGSESWKVQYSSCSTGFRLALLKLVPHLLAALKEAGANCGQFQHLATACDTRQELVMKQEGS